MSLWLYGLIGFGIVAAVAAGLWAIRGPFMQWGKTGDKAVDLTDKVLSGVGGFVDRNWEDWKKTQQKAAQNVAKGVSAIGNAIGGAFTGVFDTFKNVISPSRGGGVNYSATPIHLTPAAQNPQLAVETAMAGYTAPAKITAGPVIAKSTGPAPMRPLPPHLQATSHVVDFFKGTGLKIF